MAWLAWQAVAVRTRTPPFLTPTHPQSGDLYGTLFYHTIVLYDDDGDGDDEDDDDDDDGRAIYCI